MQHQKLTDLLTSAGSAHHTYEQTELRGVYDQEWASWYANHIIDHGLHDLVGQSIRTEELGPLMSQISELHQQSEQSEDWAEFTATKLLEHFQ
ncbi:MAG: hypothetical protein AAF702_18425 [Chloroflexota bacterium]